MGGIRASVVVVLVSLLLLDVFADIGGIDRLYARLELRYGSRGCKICLRKFNSLGAPPSLVP